MNIGRLRDKVLTIKITGILAGSICLTALAFSFPFYVAAMSQMPPESKLQLPGNLQLLYGDTPALITPYLPTGLGDKRLRRGMSVAPGAPRFAASLKSVYAYELRRYARVLIGEKNYEQALKALNEAVSQDPRNDEGLSLRGETYLGLASKVPSDAAAFFNHAYADYRDVLSRSYARPNVVGALKALIGLDKKQEAAQLCSEAYLRAKKSGDDTSIYSGYLLGLTGRTEPDATLRKRDCSLVRDLVSRLFEQVKQTGNAPNHTSLAHIFDAHMSVRADNPELYRFDDLARTISGAYLNLPNSADGPTTLAIIINPATASITHAEFLKWFAGGAFEDNQNATKATFSWGSVSGRFNEKSELVECAFSYLASTEYSAAKELSAFQLSLPYPPTPEHFYAQADREIDKLNEVEALNMLDAALSWAENPQTPQTKAAVREKLVRLKTLQYKPAQVAYVREAPFSLLYKEIREITQGNLTDFSTLDDYKKRRFFVKGFYCDNAVNFELRTGYNEYPAFGIVNLSADTPAARKLMTAIGVEIPFNTDDNVRPVPAPPGLLLEDAIDRDREQQLLRYAGGIPAQQ